MKKIKVFILMALFCPVFTALGQCDAFIHITAVGSFETSVSIDWMSNDLNSASSVRYRLASGGAYTVANGVLTPAGMMVSGLTAGRVYLFEVFGTAINCETGGNINVSDMATVVTAPRAVAPGANNVGATSFTATWNFPNDSHMNGYRLDVSASEDFSSGNILTNQVVGNVGSFLVNGLTAGTTYYYRVRGVSQIWTSSSSNVVAVTLEPPAPVAQSATLSNSTGFRANWAAATSATSYSLDLSKDNFTSLVVSDLNVGNVTNHVFSDLSPGSRYYYRIRANNANGSSGNSGVMTSITNPVSVIPEPASVGAAGFVAKWDTGTGIEGYKLDLATSNDFSSGAILTNSDVANVSSFTINGLQPGTTYYYRVQAYAAGVTSNESNIISVTTEPTAPASIAPASVDVTSFQAKWTSVSGVGSYSLDISQDNFSTFLINNLDVGNVTEYMVTNLSGASLYYYRVRANNLNGTSANSNTTELITTPEAILPEASSIYDTEFVGKWQTGSGIDGYKLDVATSSDFSTGVVLADHATNESDFAVTSLQPGTKYHYRVQAYSGSIISEESNIIALITEPSAPTGLEASELATTSFSISWNQTEGATYYEVDIATDHAFTNSVTNLTNISTRSVSVSELLPNTSYFFRVRAGNTSGISTSSSVHEVLTKPEAPASISITNKAISGFDISWLSVANAIEYEIDISADADFTERIVSYDPKKMDGDLSSLQVNDLLPCTNYFLRLRVRNASGFSDYSETIESVTRCAAPVISVLQVTVTNSDPSTKSVAVSWTDVNGAVGYRLDVSPNANFANILEDYNDIAVTGSNQLLEGLSPALTYYVRVRSVNSQGDASDHSNTPIILGIPQQVQATNMSTTSATVSWTMVPDISDYEFELSVSENFSELIEGYPKTTTLTTVPVSGMQAGTVYFLRVRARYNAQVFSLYSLPAGWRTNDADGTSNTLKIENLEAPNAFSTTGGEQKIVIVTNGQGIGDVTARLFHRKATSAGSYEVVDCVSDGNNRFSTLVADAWVDEIGMQYYAEVKDRFISISGNQTSLTLVRKKESLIPLTRFGKEINNYHIISLPDDLQEQPDIESFFGSQLGNYDNTQWRLFKFDQDKKKNIEYENIRRTKMERGQGYWFILRDEKKLMNGNGLFSATAHTFPNNADVPFNLSLKEGWNLIGNPYPFDISWSDVYDFNEGNSDVRQEFYTFDEVNAGYKIADVIPAYSGGFVYAAKAQVLTFPTTLPGPASGGRVSSRQKEGTLFNDAWTIPFKLTIGTASNNLSGIGMRTNAKLGVDPHDILNPPKFAQTIEMNSLEDCNGCTVATSIVPLASSHSWNYEVTHNEDGNAVIEWDVQRVRFYCKELLLHDLTNHRIINMAITNRYEIPSKATKLVIHLDNTVRSEWSFLQLGVPYPNPFSSNVNFPVNYSPNEEHRYTRLLIFNTAGVTISDVVIEKVAAKGLETLHWNGKDQDGNEVASGMYYYKILIINGNGIHTSFQGKIIKNK